MNVGELKKALEPFPDDYEVVISKDSEGNSFSPLEDYQEGKYDPESTWSGTFHPRNTIGDEEYSQPTSNADDAICLWPVN